MLMGRKIRTEHRMFDKRQYCLLMSRTLRQAIRSSRIEKPLVSVLRYFKALKVPEGTSVEELERRIVAASKGVQAERVFIRGNIRREVTELRSEYWSVAPRGNFDPKTGTIEWDTKPVPGHRGKYELLLYGTRAKRRIKRGGLIVFYPKEGTAKLTVWRKSGPKSLSPATFGNEKIANYKGGVGRQVLFFLESLKPKTRQFGKVRIKFVEWKGQQGIELFDMWGYA